MNIEPVYICRETYAALHEEKVTYFIKRYRFDLKAARDETDKWLGVFFRFVHNDRLTEHEAA